MKTIKISEFKATCIRVLKTVAKSGEPVLVTLRGTPLVRVEPIAAREGRRILGGLEGKMEIVGNIVHSDFADDWEADER